MPDSPAPQREPLPDTPRPPALLAGAGRAALALVVLVLALPVLAVLASWAQWNAQSAGLLAEMARTVLPGYMGTTVVLCVAVGLGVAAVGLGAAAAVTLFDFPGRRHFEWALLLPLAMPAYVLAFAYTDFLQYSGPLQTALRATLGLQGRVFPEVRNLGGAVWVFVFVLYPYVYVLARAALAERGVHLMEAARMLGAPLAQRIGAIALPMARPAVAAGVALALMETLADFGVASYFGIQTFSAGIYKAWLAMDDRVTAAQLATVLLVLVLALLHLEQRAQRRMRFAASRGPGRPADESQAVRLRGWHAAVAVFLCAFPVLMGFVLPVLFMLRPLMDGWAEFQAARFAAWAWNSVRLAGLAAAGAVLLALLMSFALRRRADWLTRGAVQLVGLGYAVPGAVIVVGVLLPVGWLQQAAPGLGAGYWVTATVLGIVWAYLVRFTAVALQSVQAGYARLSPTLDDSARILGAGPWRLLSQVHWPLLRRTTAAAALLVFVDVMKELPATLVLRPFNSDTLAVMAYQFARDERLGEAALPALAIVAVGLIPVMMLSRTLRSGR